MTSSELPTEAAEADALEQSADVRPASDEPQLGGEPSWEADPADVAEQAWSVEDDDEYGDGEP